MSNALAIFKSSSKATHNGIKGSCKSMTTKVVAHSLACKHSHSKDMCNQVVDEKCMDMNRSTCKHSSNIEGYMHGMCNLESLMLLTWHIA